MGENNAAEPTTADDTIMTTTMKDTETEREETTEPASQPHPLDETWYYYQNPTTGTVSTAPLTVRQLCRLVCPVREGMTPILPSHTRCLAVPPNGNDQQSSSSFGEWKMASELDFLREASCAQWYTSGGSNSSSNSSSTTEGPVSCRTLSEETTNTLLVYAKDITPQWTSISEVANLRLVLQALAASAAPTTTTTTTTTTNNNNDAEAEESQEMARPEDAQKVQDELEAFLSSTVDDMHKKDGDEEDDQMYESDGGTKYVRDPLTGNWIHEALAPQRPPSKKAKPTPNVKTTTTTTKNPKKNKKAKFSKRNAKLWIYATGLPTNSGVTTEDVQKYFSKAGLLDLDPETLQPKVKVYKHPNGTLKGDVSICYARPESVDLALQILDESPWDQTHTIHVQRATFQAKQEDEEDSTNTNNNKRPRKHVSEAKRKVARLALLQAQDEGFGERLAGGRKGLRIVVVQHMMDGIPENRLEDEIQAYCQEHGQLEKITCISKTKVVIIKFVEPTAASQAVQAWHGMINKRTKQAMEAVYWDGVTDYTHKEEDNPEEEEKRHDDFGKWLEETQEKELPPELRLKVADK